MKVDQLTPVYCVHIPEILEAGKIYISEEFGIAIHLCACGCNEKTVTPISGGKWTLTDNEGKITLRPSIGNWSGENPYHAHYLVTDGKIEWC